jgi:hypothetical protein
MVLGGAQEPPTGGSGFPINGYGSDSRATGGDSAFGFVPASLQLADLLPKATASISGGDADGCDVRRDAAGEAKSPELQPTSAFRGPGSAISSGSR